MELFDPGKEQFILLIPKAGIAATPCIVTAFGYLKPSGHLCDPVSGTVLFPIKITDHFRFFAKKALAFFKNSFSSSRSRIRFLRARS